jgi:hypothetical protein
LEVLVQEVMAAMTDVAVAQLEAVAGVVDRGAGSTLRAAEGLGEIGAPLGLHVGEGDAILRALGAGEGGLTPARSSSSGAVLDSGLDSSRQRPWSL